MSTSTPTGSAPTFSPAFHPARSGDPAAPHPGVRERVHTPYESAVLDGPAEGEADLEGALPQWLRGRLVRTAPALFEVGGWRAAHWFDALGMLYRLDLEPGGVRFRQAMLETQALAHARAGKMPVSTFAGRNERSFWRRLIQPVPELTDNTNVHVVPTPDGWLAMTETATQHLVDGDSLRITRSVRYRDAIGPNAGMLAHPQLDQATGEILSIAVRIGPTTEIVPFRLQPGAIERTPIGRIRLREVPYMHSFGLTPTKIVVVAAPYHANPFSFLWSNRGFIDHFRWREGRPTRVFLMDRRTGKVTEHESDPFFTFHTVNAFDDGDGVALDVCAFPDGSVFDRLRTMVTDDAPIVAGRLERLRIPRAGRRVEREVLHDANLEFPAVHLSRVAGRRHRVVWGLSFERDGEHNQTAVRRIDLDGASDARFGRADIIYGEPVFVGRPGGEREGDGVLLTVGSDLCSGKGELAVLDATTLEPIATARLPIPIPLGFHGSFLRAPGA
jgi:beta,beta-carotene 9',10'-dioxygenase